MSDHDREAAVAELVGGRRVGAVDAGQRRLEQQPLPPGRAVGDRLELALRESGDHLLVQLATAPDVDPDTPRRELVVYLAHPLGQ